VTIREISPGLERRRHAAHGEPRGAERIELETRLLPLLAPLQERAELVRLELDHDRFQQVLGSGRATGALGLEFLVQHALVRRGMSTSTSPSRFCARM